MDASKELFVGIDSIARAIEIGSKSPNYEEYSSNISKHTKEPDKNAKSLLVVLKSGGNDALANALGLKLSFELASIITIASKSSNMFNNRQIAELTRYLQENLVRKTNIDYYPDTYLANSRLVIGMMIPYISEDIDISKYSGSDLEKIKSNWFPINPQKIKTQDVVNCFRKISLLN